MKVTELRTTIVHVPLSKPIPSGQITLSHVGCALVELRTDTGLTGEGFVFTLNAKRIGLLRDMIVSLEPVVLGLDPTMSGDFWQRAWRDIAFFGHKGISIFGVGGLDMALWDLRGKAAGLNVARLIGACRTSVPVYVSGSLRLSATIDELQEEAQGIIAAGFRGMKMSVGKPEPAEDLARVRAVREVVGPATALMVDGHQQMSVASAIRLGRMLEELSLAWIEEPLRYDDHDGEAEVAEALDTPLASGENEFTRHGMIEMMRKKSADILMPDLQRMGGPTEFLKVAHAAETFGLPISSHIFTHMSLPLMATLPNGILLEYMPWFDPLYGRGLDLDGKGAAIVPDRPGWGVSFDPSAVARFART